MSEIVTELIEGWLEGNDTPTSDSSAGGKGGEKKGGAG
jgi:hypothetical protein